MDIEAIEVKSRQFGFILFPAILRLYRAVRAYLEGK